MAIVLALLIAGWLLAFAVGAQTGFEETEFENSLEPAQPELAIPQATAAANYSSPASVI